MGGESDGDPDRVPGGEAVKLQIELSAKDRKMIVDALTRAAINHRCYVTAGSAERAEHCSRLDVLVSSWKAAGKAVKP